MFFRFPVKARGIRGKVSFEWSTQFLQGFKISTLFSVRKTLEKSAVISKPCKNRVDPYLFNIIFPLEFYTPILNHSQCNLHFRSKESMHFSDHLRKKSKQLIIYLRWLWTTIKDESYSIIYNAACKIGAMTRFGFLHETVFESRVCTKKRKKVLIILIHYFC